MRRGAWFLGFFLLTAAILKLSQGQAGQSHWGSIYIVPPVEIALSVWLISGVNLRWSLGLAAALFFCFETVTLVLIFEGVDDCGCFGIVRLSPKVTYCIDCAAFITAIGALRLMSFKKLLPAVLLPSLALFSCALAAAPSQNPEMGIKVGNPWPPPGAVKCSADLSRGRWAVLIYSSDCARCDSLAADYARDACEWSAQGKKVQLALLDSDVHGSGDESAGLLIPKDNKIIRGELLLSNVYRHTPILLFLDQGRIRGKVEDWTAVDWSCSPYSSWIR